MNWKVVKLKGNSSLDFSNQLRKLNQEFLAKKWQVETNPKTGTSTYKEPSVIVIFRKDQEFVLQDVIPKKIMEKIVVYGENQLKNAKYTITCFNKRNKHGGCKTRSRKTS